MKKLFILSIIFVPVLCFAQKEYLGVQGNVRSIQTAVVIQNWSIEGLDNDISEGSFPIFINIPVLEKGNVQVSHSPAMSRYGDIELSGLSDTWIRGTYAVYKDLVMVSAGIGLPTGKTELTTQESALSGMLSQKMFKFQLPLFGQGFTASTGVIGAYPVNAQLAVGGGINYVYRGKFKYIENLPYDFDPGDQIGLNLGCDYHLNRKMGFNFDLLFTYFMKDRLNSTEIFGAATKIGAKVGFTYSRNNSVLIVIGRVFYSGKNETWNGITLITEPKNSNILQRELDGIYRIKLTDVYTLDVLFEARTYVENEYLLGQADIFGGGLGNLIRLTSNWGINVVFKIFKGDGYFNQTIPAFSGTEFRLGTIYNF